MASTHRKPHLRLGRIALLFFVLFCLPLQVASAHPADMYAQEQAVTLGAGGLEVDWKITPGPMLADSIWDEADQNKDGKISPEEATVWAGPYLAQWTIRLDGQPVQGVKVEQIVWPDKIDILEAGDQPVEIRFAVGWPDGLAGKRAVEVHNAFQEAISLNWFTLKGESGFTFGEPTQNNGLLGFELFFPENGSATPGGLTAWESGKPNLPGLTGALSGVAANLASSAQDQPRASTQANPISALLSLIRTQTFSPLFLAGAFLLSLALGSLHALTPGHGKALVAAYLVGSRGRTRDAVYLGTIVTLTHTGSVLLLGLVTLVASRYILPGLVIPWLEVGSGLLVAGFGVNLLIRRIRALVAWDASERAKKRTGRITAVQMKKGETVRSARLAAHSHTHEHGADHDHGSSSHGQHMHPGQPHSHSHGHHEHTHELPAGQVTFKSLLALGVSGGLVPCPDAIAILLVAVAVNRIPLGMLLIVAFSIGLALVLIGIGIAMVQGARFIGRKDWMNRFAVYTPALSALAVVALGVGLTLTSIHAVSAPSAGQNASLAAAQDQLAGSDPSAGGGGLKLLIPSAFDLKKGSLLYVAPDSRHFDQLLQVSLDGSQPIALTEETEGIRGFAVSPDRRSILYVTPIKSGGSTVWVMNQNGSQKRLVLECPQADCVGPVWAPDGQTVVYERYDYSKADMLRIYSLWRLDIKTGQTEPLFQDGRLPSFTPRFSADGKWLSYTSPATNTIQIYPLGGGRAQSIPYRSGIPVVWSPADDSFLYWESILRGGQNFLRLKRYIVPTGKAIDLGGSDQQEDYAAAWSPDGEWIAILRASPSADGSTLHESVLLEKPDGTLGRTVLDQDGINYENVSWSPDSRYLAYTRISYKEMGSSEVWIKDIGTDQESLVVSNGSQPVFLR